jgi:hypothetical protein
MLVLWMERARDRKNDVLYTIAPELIGPSLDRPLVFLSSYPPSSHRLRCTKTVRAWRRVTVKNRCRRRCTDARTSSRSVSDASVARPAEGTVNQKLQDLNTLNVRLPLLFFSRHAARPDAQNISLLFHLLPLPCQCPDATQKEQSSHCCAYMRGSRSPAPHSVRPALHAQRDAPAHAPALAVLPPVPPLVLPTADGGHINPFHPSVMPHVRSRPRSCLFVRVRVSRLQ